MRVRLDDWLNPIVVKELRQAVNGKFVAAALLLLLVIQLATLGIYVVFSGDSAGRFDAGRSAFMFLLGILMGICLLFVPAYTSIRMALERDTNVDLLFVTTIKPSAIVWGKLVAALAITVLIFSACLPFMVFTYWLRGIDLPSIFVLMTGAFLVVAVAVQLATLVACLAAGRILKILLSLLTLILFLQVYIATLSWSYYSLYSGVGSQLGGWSFWGPALAAIIIIASLIGLLFSLSVASIKPVSSNRALPVRLFVTGMWGVSAIAAAAISYRDKSVDPLKLWSVLWVLVFAAAFFVAVSERERLGPRVARKIPASGLRLPAFFLFSGAANGVAWASLMSVLTYLTVQFLSSSSTTLRTAGPTSDSQVWVAGLAFYGLAYSMSALLARRYFLDRWIASKHTWLVAIVLLGVGCAVPLVMGYILATGNVNSPEDIGQWLVSNPFMLGVEAYQLTYLVFAAGWALLVTLLNADWFIEQIESFRPPDVSLSISDNTLSQT